MKSIKYEDSLEYLYPEIAKEWHPVKNGDLTPKDVSIGSSIKVWWFLHYYDEKTNKFFDFEWEATINNRVKKKSNCPFLLNKKVLEGYNDIATTHPELLKEWDFEKNVVKPNEVTFGSSVSIYWKCENGHSWRTAIRHRINGNCCPKCNKKSLEEWCIDNNKEYILDEWDYDKNTLIPSEVSFGASIDIHWKCKKGHYWVDDLHNRIYTSNQSGCPYCNNRKVLYGFNDFETWCKNTNNLYLLDEWDYSKNDVIPSEIVYTQTKIKIWWKCMSGHSFLLLPIDRTGIYDNRLNCPTCSKERTTSFPEQAVSFYLRQVFNNIEERNKKIIDDEIDIYIPSIKTAIEYDGFVWHEKNEKVDNRKNIKCIEKGIRLIRIREQGLKTFDNCINLIRKDRRTDESLNEVIIDLFTLLGVNNIKVDVADDNMKIYSQYVNSIKENSLAKKYPDIASEWDYDKNEKVTPDMINYGSPKEVWWKCEQGHSYKMRVNTRTNANIGCPYCGGTRVLYGFNDLETQYPNIAMEWDYIKNKEIQPKDVYMFSSKEYWWICKEGHSYKRAVRYRTIGNSPCPICTYDIEVLFPNLAEEWDRDKNKGIELKSFYKTSTQKVWWKCKVCGHSWFQRIDSRCCDNAQCPNCNKIKQVNRQSKKVKNLDTGVIYRSCKEASEKMDIASTGINRACNGKAKTAGGYRWAYYEE